MKDVCEEILQVLSRGEKAALSTIVSSRGSLPMSKKAKMLVREDGTFVGTVGGGCLEADVWSEARQVMVNGSPTLQRFILTEEHAGDEGLNCGGNAEIFTEPVLPGLGFDVYTEVNRLLDSREHALLATLVSGSSAAPGQKMVLHGDGTCVGSLGDPALDELVRIEMAAEKNDDVLKVLTLEHDEGTVRVFVEALQSDPDLFIFGGGHVSRAIASIAGSVGFRITIIDDRPAFANAERFPWAAEVVVADFDDVVSKLAIDATSYLIAVTRGHQWDQPIIEQAIRTNAKYIGMIGSRRKVALMWEKLEKNGIPRAKLDRVHSPIGLDIHADTPEEIAVSVVAELIQVRRSAGKPTHLFEAKTSELTGSQ